MDKRVGGICMLFCILFLTGTLFGQMHSLGVKFSDVILSGMKPGMVYSLKKEEGIPFTVINHTKKKADVEVTIGKPIKSQMKENYEPIPDVSWISVFPSRFSLGQNEEMDCDIIISIPPDEKYANRHFQAMIHTESAGKPGGRGISISMALESRIRFSTGPRPEKVIEEYRQRVFSALKLDMYPMSLFIRDALPIGKSIVLDGENFPNIQVVNKSKENYKIELYIAENPGNYGTNPEYEPSPSEIKIEIKNKKIKSKPKTIQDIFLKVKVPDKKEFYGKKFAFVVVGKILGFDIPIELFSRVYFKTEEKNEGKAEK